MQVPLLDTQFSVESCKIPSDPPSHQLFQDARLRPSSIDSFLRPYLYSHSFPEELEVYMQHYTSTCVTPGLHGVEAPHRPQWYYANCLIHGMLLGRAYSLLSTPVRPPQNLSNPSDFPFSKLPAELRLQIYSYYKEDLAQRQRYWEIMTRIFIKALWSGRDPEEGSRYITGIILLTCGHALSSSARLLRGYGKHWIWYDDRLAAPEHAWGWPELRDAIMATADLPRMNNDITGLRTRWEKIWQEWDAHREITGQTLFSSDPQQRNSLEYVSKNVLHVLDLTREHLRTDERDWTPPEIVAKFLTDLFDGNEEGRKIWEATGIVPRALDVQYDGGLEHGEPAVVTALIRAVKGDGR
ncbi:hypothetical protein CC78DRAFT_577300 [Lojkania enalia]|uniref:Uncharacterized protein n=1 Tax=Lojkania enalia TaxID=147567 RepID=A0A9P4N5P6_9PLEO|nr:hypothetical protein CC78DRAFT_577300 [Didymosphaeria enalia]